MRGQHRTTREMDLHNDMAGVRYVPILGLECRRMKPGQTRGRIAEDATAFCVEGIPGIEEARFFCCRDKEQERELGIEPLYIVCEQRSGAIVPTRMRTNERERAVDAAGRLFANMDEDARREVVAQYAELAKQRGR